MKKVLVVEDDPELGELLLCHLAAAGYEARLCMDGLRAWALLRAEGGFALAVLDVGLPGLNGFNLCRRIRRDPGLRALPVLMVSARDRVEDQVEGYRSGADDYLPKPLVLELLLARLQVLERRFCA